MPRSLREALLDQFTALQERGIAPSEVPQADEAPLVVVESAGRGRNTRSRRDFNERMEGDESLLDLNGQFDRDRKRLPRRDHRVEDARDRRRPAAGRGRPHGRGDGELELEPPPPLGMPSVGSRPPLRPMFPRPLGGPGMRPPPFGPPGQSGPDSGAPGRTAMLQQRAEQRRRDDADISEMRRLLAEFQGQEIDDEAMETFSRALAEETGALPPPGIVVSAIKESATGDPVRIGDAVRQYYRKRRAKAAASGASAPSRVASTV